MKKTIYMTAVMAGIILASCQTPAQKEEAAEVKVDSAQSDLSNAKSDLKDAKQEVNPEYPAFKRNAEEQIADNDKKIVKLRGKQDASDNTMANNMREKRIDALEKENADLRSRLLAYETQHSDWETFKVSFNHDMDKVNKAFADFGKDLKK